MSSSRKHITAILTIIVAIAASLTGFILIQQTSYRPTTSTSTPIERTSTHLDMVLEGAGATFVYPQLSEWIHLFHSKTGIKVSYQSVGSGAGLSMFFQGTVDFACSDPPLSRETWEKYRGEVIQIPWLAGAVVVVYNIPELSGDNVLKLDEIAIARIYKGEIVYWDDPYIKQLNPDIADKLPHREIIAVYRSDSSGTTEIFTTYLHKATHGMWPKELVGKTVNWPVATLGRGIGGKGNEGVTQIITQVQYSIGYVEWGYAIANNLSIALLRNAAGVFAKPSEKSIASALENINIPSSPLDDFSHIVYEAVYAPGDESYPIAALTHLVLWRRYNDSSKAYAMREFLKWILEEGYNHIIPGYVAPPEPIKNLLREAINIMEKV
ncbi:MAG: phosphate ABC transporter substrate-binding protein PstS [Desulfurococcaceae archaeon]